MTVPNLHADETIAAAAELVLAKIGMPLDQLAVKSQADAPRVTGFPVSAHADGRTAPHQRKGSVISPNPHRLRTEPARSDLDDARNGSWSSAAA